MDDNEFYFLSKLDLLRAIVMYQGILKTEHVFKISKSGNTEIWDYYN